MRGWPKIKWSAGSLARKSNAAIIRGLGRSALRALARKPCELNGARAAMPAKGSATIIRGLGGPRSGAWAEALARKSYELDGARAALPAGFHANHAACRLLHSMINSSRGPSGSRSCACEPFQRLRNRSRKRQWHTPPDPGAARLGFRGWHSRGYLPHFDMPGVIQMLNYRLETPCRPAAVTNGLRCSGLTKN